MNLRYRFFLFLSISITLFLCSTVVFGQFFINTTICEKNRLTIDGLPSFHTPKYDVSNKKQYDRVNFVYSFNANQEVVASLSPGSDCTINKINADTDDEFTFEQYIDFNPLPEGIYDCGIITFTDTNGTSCTIAPRPVHLKIPPIIENLNVPKSDDLTPDFSFRSPASEISVGVSCNSGQRYHTEFKGFFNGAYHFAFSDTIIPGTSTCDFLFATQGDTSRGVGKIEKEVIVAEPAGSHDPVFHEGETIINYSDYKQSPNQSSQRTYSCGDETQYIDFLFSAPMDYSFNDNRATLTYITNIQKSLTPYFSPDSICTVDEVEIRLSNSDEKITVGEIYLGNTFNEGIHDCGDIMFRDSGDNLLCTFKTSPYVRDTTPPTIQDVTLLSDPSDTTPTYSFTVSDSMPEEIITAIECNDNLWIGNKTYNTITIGPLFFGSHTCVFRALDGNLNETQIPLPITIDFPGSTDSSNKNAGETVLVLVHEDVHDNIAEELRIWSEDIKREQNLRTAIQKISDDQDILDHLTEVRKMYRTENLNGVLLVGNVPTGHFVSEKFLQNIERGVISEQDRELFAYNRFNFDDRIYLDYSNNCAQVPSERITQIQRSLNLSEPLPPIFVGIDDEGTKNIACHLQPHDASHPYWVARLTPNTPTMSNTTLLKYYFQRNHSYRTKTPLPASHPQYDSFPNGTMSYQQNTLFFYPWGQSEDSAGDYYNALLDIILLGDPDISLKDLSALWKSKHTRLWEETVDSFDDWHKIWYTSARNALTNNEENVFQKTATELYRKYNQGYDSLSRTLIKEKEYLQGIPVQQRDRFRIFTDDNLVFPNLFDGGLEFLQELERGHELFYYVGHGNERRFETGITGTPTSPRNTFVSTYTLDDTSPFNYFLSHFGSCSIANFTKNNYIGGKLLFGNRYGNGGLILIAAPNLSSASTHDSSTSIIHSLRNGTSFYKAASASGKLVEQNSPDNIYGDPTLKMRY